MQRTGGRMAIGLDQTVLAADYQMRKTSSTRTAARQTLFQKPDKRPPERNLARVTLVAQDDPEGRNLFHDERSIQHFEMKGQPARVRMRRRNYTCDLGKRKQGLFDTEALRGIPNNIVPINVEHISQLLLRIGKLSCKEPLFHFQHSHDIAHMPFRVLRIRERRALAKNQHAIDLATLHAGGILHKT